MNIQNKVFVVTGAGGGIGGELVRALVAGGAKVAAVDLKQEPLDTLKNSLGEKSADVSVHALNIADRKAVFLLPNAVVQTHGSVDALINCAGIVQPFVRVNDLDFESIERVMNVNFYGTLNMTKAFLPRLLERP